jgi:hypothetical protein
MPFFISAGEVVWELAAAELVMRDSDFAMRAGSGSSFFAHNL